MQYRILKYPFCPTQPVEKNCFSDNKPAHSLLQQHSSPNATFHSSTTSPIPRQHNKHHRPHSEHQPQHLRCPIPSPRLHPIPSPPHHRCTSPHPITTAPQYQRHTISLRLLQQHGTTPPRHHPIPSPRHHPIPSPGQHPTSPQ